ncbi:type VI secretion system-associated protein TagF [Siculibacillus lacustris]|uniref:Type VI secretion system-associated protein TagF n=1 Tax=Siculibacillus lacustris TaxID=1549641 RepID=A0A4Q9VP66_9HYPH|nr:type VI secretion system-associated protein TagF [Siculibacillus lacustris]TBW36592.1 type VI secretion system-associated protein TagF [Siculibacillus lacustris]
MRPGLYGKLPCKRDFIAEAVPRGFLPLWEPWLQGSVAASRMALGRSWQEIYLSAPIWRFWIGARHCGRNVLGAVMPSVDGVGRYFPLTLMLAAEEGEIVAPPFRDRHEAFFAAAEDLLLDALGEGVVFETLTARLADLPLPEAGATPPLPETARVLGDGSLVASGAGASIDEVFGGWSATRETAGLATATFWWTIGGGGIPAMVVSGDRLPEPAHFEGFLTGRFDRTS